MATEPNTETETQTVSDLADLGALAGEAPAAPANAGGGPAAPLLEKELDAQ